MFTKSFLIWLERNQYAWFPKFKDVEAISSFVLEHTTRGTRVGKVLNKLKLDCDAFTIQCGVLAWNATQYVPQIEIIEDVATVQEAYTEVYSCMTDNAKGMATFLCHPLLHGQGLRLAVYRQHGRITGRCLVDIYNKRMLTIYASGNLLEFRSGLEELGYMEVEGNIRVISNKMLPMTGFLPYLDEFGGHCYFAKDQSKDWCFAWPDGCWSKEAVHESLTSRIKSCAFDVHIEALLICTDDDGQWVSLKDVSW